MGSSVPFVAGVMPMLKLSGIVGRFGPKSGRLLADGQDALRVRDMVVEIEEWFSGEEMILFCKRL